MVSPQAMPPDAQAGGSTVDWVSLLWYISPETITTDSMASILKRRRNMATDTLDVRGLPDEKVGYLQRLIESWRQQTGRTQHPGQGTDGEIVFATHPSKVIGRLTRRDIYDHL
jgi:hypothetical protein